MGGSNKQSAHAISVVIPTIGRWDSLAHILSDLRRVATEAPLDIEVVVVGDGMARDVVERELGALTHHPLDVKALGLHVRSGVSRSRNTGALHATSPTLVFLDDDVRLTKNWASALLEVLDAGWSCATGPVTTQDSSVLSRAREARYKSRYQGLRNGDHVEFLAGGNSLVTADAFKAAGGFPSIPVGSDSALLARMDTSGRACKFAAELIVTHIHDRGWRAAFRSAWYSGKSATSAGVRVEASSVGRSLRAARMTGFVNAALLAAKAGGLLVQHRGMAK